jgi:hypothetical protein
MLRRPNIQRIEVVTPKEEEEEEEEGEEEEEDEEEEDYSPLRNRNMPDNV